jgi:hypothetical protein
MKTLLKALLVILITVAISGCVRPSNCIPGKSLKDIKCGGCLSKRRTAEPAWNEVVTDRGFAIYHQSVSRVLRQYFGKQVKWECQEGADGKWTSAASYLEVFVLAVGQDDVDLPRDDVINILWIQFDFYKSVVAQQK